MCGSCGGMFRVYGSDVQETEDTGTYDDMQYAMHGICGNVSDNEIRRVCLKKS